MTTRIKKYFELRKQVEKEIKFLELKYRNSEKVKKFKKLIDKIDNKIFIESKLESEKIFPNFSSFTKIENERDKKKIQETLNQTKEWNEKISEIKNWNKKYTIKEYIPELENENFIYNNLNLIKQKTIEISNKFQNIKKEKEIINTKANEINEYEIKNLILENVISENNFNIEQQKEIIEKIEQNQKNRTKWIWFFNIGFLLIQIICITLILTIK